MPETIVMDTSAMVDHLVDSPLAGLVADRIEGSEVNLPAHSDAEVLSALGRLQRAGHLNETEVEQRIGLTARRLPAAASSRCTTFRVARAPQAPQLVLEAFRLGAVYGWRDVRRGCTAPSIRIG